MHSPISMLARSPESFKPDFTPPPEDPHAAEPTVDVITSEEREEWRQYDERIAMNSAEVKARREAQFHAAKLENTEQNFARTIARGDLVTAYDQIAYLATHGGAPQTIASMEQQFRSRLDIERSRLEASPSALRLRQEQFLVLYENAITRRHYDTPIRFELTDEDMERHSRSLGKAVEGTADAPTDDNADRARRKERTAAVQYDILPTLMAQALNNRIDVLTALNALQTARETAPSLYKELRSNFLERLAAEIARLRAKEALAKQPIRTILANATSALKQWFGGKHEAAEIYTAQQLQEIQSIVMQGAQPFEREH